MDAFNQQVFEAVLAARHLTLESLSGRLGISEAGLRSQIQGVPSEKIINEISDQLVVPSFVFFMDHPPTVVEPIADFRSSRPPWVGPSRQLIESVDMGRRFQEVAEDLGYHDHLGPDILGNAKGSVRQSPELIDLVTSAAEVRDQLGLSILDQLEAKDALAFYAICRKAVESTGVFVLHESFPSEDGSGFCLADSQARLIVINTRNQTAGRRTFTLMHELGHALIRRTGVSDPFVTLNRAERACNEFAARLLVPPELAQAAFDNVRMSHEPTLEQVYRASRFLKISQEAVVVRFSRLKLIAPDSHRDWLNAVKAAGGNPDWISNKGGGNGTTPQEKIKLAKYGYTFAKVFGDALRGETLSPIEIFRISGLKPKYQKPYFDFAAYARAEDAVE